MKTSKIGIVVLIAAGILVQAPAVSAGEPEKLQQNRYLGDRWSVRLFGAISELTSDVSVGRELGAFINLEELLGFDDQIATGGLDAFYRLSKNRKHMIRIGYNDFSRDAYVAVAGTIPIFDVEFIGEVDSSFGNQIGTVSYQ
jgi:hypothetical protein